MGSTRQTTEDNGTEQHLWEDVYLSQEEHITPEDDFHSSYFPAGPGDRSSQYVPGLGFARYFPALRNLAPIRRKKKAENSLGVDESGLWAFLTYNWLTKYMEKAYTNGLTVEDIPSPCPQDTCDFNAQRFENLWQDELVEKGPQSASLNQVTWRFIRTRVLLSSLCMCLSICIGFLSVALFMRYLLEYAESENASPWTGLKWAVLLTVSEMVRVTLYANVWTTNYRTAIRLRTAFQAMLYRKILRVYSFEGKSIGELISLFSNDGQRIFDLVIMGPMIIGGPVSVLLAMIYVYWILGPWPVLGLCSIFIFYPLQYFLSQLTGFLKRQVFSVTDNRLTVISEILSCIKFVKLYAWAKVYLRKISDIRRRELSLLRKVSYCNSFASSVSTSAPVIAGILTFLIHIIVEKNITASQAFPIMSYLFISMRLYVTYTFYGMSNIVEIGIICNRFKGVMLLNETTTSLSRPVDKSQAICIADGIFARHRNADQNIIYKMKKRKSLTVGLRRNTGTSEDLEKDLLNPPPPPSNYVEILFDINFFAPKGSLIGVCGPVGCGKSSLLAGILGHLPLTRGKLCREGLCAYVSQQPWLLNATLRENILLGEKFMARKYYDAVRCCELGKDMDSLPAGDSTEIGERGVNLSGGQRQRVALARALYSDRDIYLLDDPLSAVDAEVGRHIFEECILGALRAKTVLFVSHQIQFLNQCEELIVMKEGRIVERGHPADLLARDSEYKLMMDTFAQRTMSTDLGKEVPNEITSISVTQNGPTKNSTDKSKSGIDGVLIREEKTIHGALKSSTFMSYIAACGGFLVFSCLPLVMLFFVGTSAFTSWWLHIWINAGSGKVRISNITEGNTTFPEGNSSTTPLNENFTELYGKATELYENATELYENATELYENATSELYENSTELNFPNLIASSLPGNISHFSGNLIDNPQYYMYLYVYCASIGVIFLASLLRGVVFTEVTLRASSLIHQKLVDKMMKAYLSFFETTPIGRIQNLFSRDIDEVETKLPSTLENLIHGLWNISFSILFICFAFPYFVIALIFVCLIYFYVHKKFRSGLRELKRLDNTTRSPILSNVSATFHGIDSIHAFGKEKGFIYRFNASYDLNTTCSYMCSIANRWLALRVDAIAVFIMFLASLMVIFTHGLVPPSLAGLAIAYATTLCGAFQYTVRLVTDNEVKLISLERINSYLQYMEEEGGHGPKGVPKESWPELGSIRFKNVQLKYREELEPALKGISFHIRSEEKIGIVGRTGAGKSSIVAGLFRLVELSRGTISIDNLDIANLELTALRSRLSIIPQDPVLFTGSVRSNLDPADEHSDEEIWSVLEKTSLKTRISLCPDKLDSKVIFNGDNFSTGEKQLLCLARALLRKSKILVLDEATSGLDHETERIIQNTLFAEMKYCTVIIIAHRLETIKACHRVLVMEDGKVVEFDEPKTLLQDTNSVFFRLMSASQHNGPLP